MIGPYTLGGTGSPGEPWILTMTEQGTPVAPSLPGPSVMPALGLCDLSRLHNIPLRPPPPFAIYSCLQRSEVERPGYSGLKSDTTAH